MDELLAVTFISVSAATLLLLALARTLLPPLGERSNWRVAKMDLHGSSFEWTFHLSTGILVLSTLAGATASVTPLPGWFTGVLIGALAALAAFAIARPPRGQDLEYHAVDGKSLTISLGVHLTLGAALTELFIAASPS